MFRMTHHRSAKTSIDRTGTRRRTHFISMLVLAVLTLLITTAGVAEEPTTEAGSAADLDQVHQHLSWLVGSWSGTGLGGDVEEVWLPSRGQQMMGMFRMVVDGKIRFSEIMTIGTFDGQIELRLKHFDDQLHGWETKDEVTSFPFSESKPGHVSFRGLEFIKETDRSMRIELKMKSNGEVRTEIFNFRRTG